MTKSQQKLKIGHHAPLHIQQSTDSLSSKCMVSAWYSAVARQKCAFLLNHVSTAERVGQWFWRQQIKQCCGCEFCVCWMCADSAWAVWRENVDVDELLSSRVRLTYHRASQPPTQLANQVHAVRKSPPPLYLHTRLKVTHHTALPACQTVYRDSCQRDGDLSFDQNSRNTSCEEIMSQKNNSHIRYKMCQTFEKHIGRTNENHQQRDNQLGLCLKSRNGCNKRSMMTTDISSSTKHVSTYSGKNVNSKQCFGILSRRPNSTSVDLTPYSQPTSKPFTSCPNTEKTSLSEEPSAKIFQHIPKNFRCLKTKQVSILDSLPAAQQHYRILEQRLLNCKISPHPLTGQPKLTAGSRSLAILWLIDMCDQLQMHVDTLFNAIACFDTYCSQRPNSVDPSNMQLVVSACLRLASKLEESKIPSLKLLSDLSKGACSPVQIGRAELDLACVMGWRLMKSTPICWARLFIGLSGDPLPSRLPQVDDTVWFTRAYHVLQAAMVDVTTRQFDSRQLAAAAVQLAATKPFDICRLSGLNAGELSSCLHFLHPYSKLVSNTAGLMEILMRVKGCSANEVIVSRLCDPKKLAQTGKAASWKLASSALFPDTIITPQLPITFHPFPSPATISTEIHNETTPQLVPQGRLSCSAYSTKRALHLRDLKDQEASSCTTSGEQLMPVYTNLVRTQSRHRKLHRHSL
eukprot:gene1530-4680_t